VMTRAEGWVKDVQIADVPASLAYMLPIFMLRDVEHYTTSIGDNAVSFIITLPEEPPVGDPQGGRQGTDGIDQEQILMYNDKDTVVNYSESGNNEENGSADLEENLLAGAIRLSMKWLPSDDGMPDSVAVMIYTANGYLGDVSLTRDGGWTLDVPLANDSAALADMQLDYMLRDFEYEYKTETRDSGAAFVVRLPGAEDEDPAVYAEYTQPVDPLNPDRSVVITAAVAMGKEVTFGEKITLVATLQGYDSLDYTTAWKLNRGFGWETIDDAEGLSYSFILTEENALWSYMMEVTIEHPAVQGPASGGPET